MYTKYKDVLNNITHFYSLWAGHAIGRDAFLEENIIVPLSKQFDDLEDIVRKNAHKAIEMISETPAGKYIILHTYVHEEKFILQWILFSREVVDFWQRSQSETYSTVKSICLLQGK